MPKYIVSLLQKTSNDTFMSDKKPELSAAMKSKLEPKKFTKNPILGTKFTIAISSAKGGVGKSTFATNLALALKKVGCKVGLLDADIYGPSIPKMFDINEKPKSDGQKLDPITKYDIQCMSIGFLADQQTPMIWRGPMVTSAIKTFTQKVNWKDLDFIIDDMPPGTGDTQLTFSQEIKMDGVICGHIHHAESRKIGKVDYLNCGDWVESCTALVENINGDMQLVNWSCSKKIKELLENFNTKPRLISPKIAA